MRNLFVLIIIVAVFVLAGFIFYFLLQGSKSGIKSGGESVPNITSVNLSPTEVLCGTIQRNTIPINNWSETPVDCSDKILQKDSNYTIIYGNQITLHSVPAVLLKFDLSSLQFKTIDNIIAHIEMVCKSSLSIYTLTQYNEWKAIPDFYFHCPDVWTKDKATAEVTPLIVNNSVSVLITPGSGDSEADIDYGILNVSYS